MNNLVAPFPYFGGKRRLNDDRNFLYQEMKRLIREKRPAFFVAENVRGLISMGGRRVLPAMIREFEEIGYCVDYRLLNARDYGVPQNRERVIIIGNRLGVENPFPSPTHSAAVSLFDDGFSGIRPHRTLRDAIGDLEELGGLPNHEIDRSWERNPEYSLIMRHIKQGQKLCNVRLGERSVNTWDISEVFGSTTLEERAILIAIAKNRRKKQYGPKDGNPLSAADIEQFVTVPDVQRHLDTLVAKDYLVVVDKKYELKNAFNGIFRRLRWDEPSEAVLTVFNSPRFYVHPSKDRPFSVRELARVQGFPDDFVFSGSMREQYTQVGNAVPPDLAEAVAAKIIQTLRTCDTRLEPLTATPESRT